MEYTVMQYLLDRANITDTITRMSAYIDRRDWDQLGKEVFAPKIWVDYSQVSGVEPHDVSTEDQLVGWKESMGSLTTTHHQTTGILIDLPQPGPAREVPNKITASANTIATLKRDNARGGPITQNGGYYTFELTRQADIGGSSNPWRITRLKVHPAWYSGNLEVMIKE